MTLNSEGPLDGLEVVAWDVAPKGVPAEPTKSHSFVAEIEKQGGVISPLVTLSQASSVIAGLRKDRLEAELAMAQARREAQEVRGAADLWSMFSMDGAPGMLPKLWGMVKEWRTRARAAEARISSLEEENKRLREDCEQYKQAGNASYERALKAEARIAPLEAALKPFADYAPYVDMFVEGRAINGGSPVLPTKNFRRADFQRALQALEDHNG